MSSKVDFFIPECQINNIKNPVFGICDDPDVSEKTPAYVSFSNPENWTAIVKNQTGTPVNFTAIDNCVDIRRDNGDQENRCDAMLTNTDNIIFVELKDQSSSGWLNHAVDDQLQTTIDIFKENYDISRYRYKKAVVCNKKRPYFHESYKEKMAVFFVKNHIRLSISRNIVVK